MQSTPAAAPQNNLGMISKKEPAHAWCTIASLDSTSKQLKLTPVAGDLKQASPFFEHKENSYDVTASPDWMEWIEQIEGRESDEGGAGAYDTMRCDITVKAPEQQNNQRLMNIWGKDFHVTRLQKSFASLLNATTAEAISERAIETAVKDSDLLLQALIAEAQSSFYLKENSLVALGEKEDEDHTWIQLIKLTLLWSLPKNITVANKEFSEASADIVVRGHACSTGKPVPVFRSVKPIVVTLAAIGHDGDHVQPSNSDGVKIDENLPTRFQNPQSKVASWCKQRKKMDNPETYKPPGVAEVLMMRPTTTTTGQIDDIAIRGSQFSSLELLEGLSSNVCVIYKDGTLRTAEEGVLFGYVRHLVLESAERCGLKVDTTTPISMQDALDGKWSEVFITSSSRLIWPISRILLPTSHDEAYRKSNSSQEECDIEGFTEFWRDPVLTSLVPVSTPQWQELLEDILRNAGYKR